MVVTFFGNRQIHEDIYPALLNTIIDLIEHHGAHTFYVGNQGAFDDTVRKILKMLSREYPHMRYTVMLAYLPWAHSDLYPEDFSNGNIIKHLSQEELQEECRNYLHIHTDNDELAIAVLQEKLKVTNFDVQKDGSITLYEYVDNVAPVSRTLFENGVLPLELSTGGENLEEYYMSMVGGERTCGM